MTQTANQKIVPWVIWAAILQGLIIIQIFIGGGMPSGVDVGIPPLPLATAIVVPAILAIGIRVILIPKLQRIESQLPAMIVGLALAEMTGLLGIFLIDESYGKTRLVVLVMSLLSILTLAPIYVGRKKRNDPYQREV